MEQEVVRNRWHVIEVAVPTANAIIRDIKAKIPADWKQMGGVMFSATEFGKDTQNFRLGFLTMHINGFRSNPIQFDVANRTLASQKRKYLPLALDEALLPGTRINAVYVDKGDAVAYPYTLRIYMHGTHVNIK
jgi:hypothetical protein